MEGSLEHHGIASQQFLRYFTDVRLQNSAACAKATSSLKVVMMLCPSESGGGLAASHSIVLLLADEREVFSFQI